MKRKEYTWREAISIVLRESGEALSYKDITERIISNGMRSNLGATPANTVYAQLLSMMKSNQSDPPIRKVGKGIWIWGNGTVPIAVPPKDENNDLAFDDEYQRTELISSFGVLWHRDSIDWSGVPKLLGQVTASADVVDFSKQIGVYLLYDGREVVYVGRATDNPLGKRLSDHTKDRLSSRWDRFTWFGILPISEDGALMEQPPSYRSDRLIHALEAILIEALEPRQNRRRGDDIGASEFLQVIDPRITKKRIKDMMDKM